MSCVRIIFLVFGITVSAVYAFAAQTMNFDQSRFVAAQGAGQPILIDIRASWCPTCAAQKPIIEHLAAAPEYKELLIFQVDFDSQKDIVRLFGARSQSTLIAFHGTRETARSVGDTDATSIANLLHATAN